MNLDDSKNLPVAELLRLTQTNVTPDPEMGFKFAEIAYDAATDDIERGIAARQGGFRAEQAGKRIEIVNNQFGLAREALSSQDPLTQRELIATETLTLRAYALRIERTGARIGEVALAAGDARDRGEKILKEQHVKRGSWDRFGTMHARHTATFEAMNGKAITATVTALRGLWRAIRAKKEGTPEDHAAFVKKQIIVNLAAGGLAVSKVVDKVPMLHERRHRLALSLLGERFQQHDQEVRDWENYLLEQTIKFVQGL